jgi:hypothetical protein
MNEPASAKKVSRASLASFSTAYDSLDVRGLRKRCAVRGTSQLLMDILQADAHILCANGEFYSSFGLSASPSPVDSLPCGPSRDCRMPRNAPTSAIFRSRSPSFITSGQSIPVIRKVCSEFRAEVGFNSGGRVQIWNCFRSVLPTIHYFNRPWLAITFRSADDSSFTATPRWPFSNSSMRATWPR